MISKICFLVASELIIIASGMVFGVISNAYIKRNIEKLQLQLMGASAVITVIGWLVVFFSDDPQNMLEMWNILVVFNIFMAVCSIFKYKKAIKDGIEEIVLKADEYILHSDFSFMLGNVPLIPNVQRVAQTKDDVIVFSASAPEKEVDATFICKKIEDNVYDCTSYIPASDNDVNHWTKATAIYNLICAILVPVFYLISEVEVSIFGKFDKTIGSAAILGGLFISVFSISLLKLLKIQSGVGAFLMKAFSWMLLVVSTVDIIYGIFTFPLWALI